MEEQEILTKVLDEIFTNCKDYILANYEEADNLSCLKVYIKYYKLLNKEEIDDEDFDVLLKEILEFLL